MRYYLDTEFDGKGGPILSLGIVREDGASHYFVDPEAAASARDPWVRKHVLPIMTTGSPFGFHMSNVGLVLCAWFRDDPRPEIVADWPDDIAHLCRELTARSLYWSDPSGQLGGLPALCFTVGNYDAYPTTLPGAVQHNAWWDAMALRHLFTPGATAAETPASGTGKVATVIEWEDSREAITPLPHPSIAGEGETKPGDAIEAAKAWMLGQAHTLRDRARALRHQATVAEEISARDPAWKYMAEQPGRHRADASHRELVADGLEAILTAAPSPSPEAWKPDREAVAREISGAAWALVDAGQPAIRVTSSASAAYSTKHSLCVADRILALNPTGGA